MGLDISSVVLVSTAGASVFVFSVSVEEILVVPALNLGINPLGLATAVSSTVGFSSGCFSSALEEIVFVTPGLNLGLNSGGLFSEEESLTSVVLTSVEVELAGICSSFFTIGALNLGLNPAGFATAVSVFASMAIASALSTVFLL